MNALSVLWLSPAQRKWRAISTCAAIALIGTTCALAGIFWWQPLSDQHARLELLLERRDQIEAVIATQNQLNAALKKAQASLILTPVLWPESSRIQAQAAMSKRLNELIDQIGDHGRHCKLENMSPVAEVEGVDSARPVGVTVRMLCGNTEWLQLASALDSSSPSMFVDNLTIQVQQNGALNMQHSMASSVLQIQMDVIGFIWKEPMIAAAS